MLIIFFDIKWTVHKGFVLAGQSGNSAYFCDALRRLREKLRRLHLKLWRQKNWLDAASQQRTVSHFLFHWGIFYQKQHDYRYPPTIIYLFPQLKIKLKGLHFDTGRGRIADGPEYPNKTRIPGI
jgi:hypothetical protein